MCETRNFMGFPINELTVQSGSGKGGILMQYRTMKKSGDSLSILGYGCMRLPQNGSRIDEPRARAQLRYAIDHGVNYVDTAIPYHMGASEPFLGRALLDGYREKVKLATKMPHWNVKKREDMDRFLSGQLASLQTGRIDYYLVHNMQAESWKKLKGLGFADFVAKAKADGRIRNIGFSFHGGTKDLKAIVDDYAWDFCQIQFNYLDRDNQAGVEGLKYAAAKGLGVIVMEPLRGGMLARNASHAIQAIRDEADVKRSPAEWALRWVWNFPEVTVVLSGMNEEAHIEENLRVAGEALPGSLTEKEISLVDRVREAYLKSMKVGCTGCRYCMPCPAGVDIPACFETYNTKYLGGGAGPASIGYVSLVGGAFSGNKPGYASQCKGCGKCEKACPQHLPIRQHLQEVRKEFEGPTLPVMFFMVKVVQRFFSWRATRNASPPAKGGSR
ncbi:MAG: putative oxidoreductase [Methanocella sp. PtaU1.Bin125]|nr:MAG: putative oxidoreductase [Methanocella sp. PtaU1.Bin125]